MSQKFFGSGVLFAEPVGGDLATNPTPLQFGIVQNVSLDISFDVKELYGRNQFPDDVARGKGKISGKAAFAQINGKVLNDLIFGQTLTAGEKRVSLDQDSGAIPTTPFEVTPTVPSSGTYVSDLGVRYLTTGLPLAKVTGTVAAGEYKVDETTGKYTFSTGDAAAHVLISYEYSVSASGNTAVITNQLMGFGPVFQMVLNCKYRTKEYNLKLMNCIATKLTQATKNDDYMIPEFDFSAFADASGNVYQFSAAE